MMTGVESPRPRNSRRTSRPSRCGSPRSSRTISNVAVRNASAALRPSATPSTAYPSWRNARSRPLAIIRSSSTTNTRMTFSPGGGLSSQDQIAHFAITETCIVDRTRVHAARDHRGQDDGDYHRQNEGAVAAGQLHHQHDERDRTMRRGGEHRGGADDGTQPRRGTGPDPRPSHSERAAQKRPGRSG